MKKLVCPILLCSFMSATQAWGTDSCEDFFLLNLAPGSVCKTRSNKMLYKDKDGFSVVNSLGKGLKFHNPTKNQELTKEEARDYCKAQGYRLPSVAELQEFVDDTYSARLGGITSCYNVNRSFFTAESTSNRGSKNTVPLEGKASWAQRDYEIAAFDLTSNTAVVRYEQQKFNAICAEDLEQAPALNPVRDHECSEYWIASAKVGTTCTLDNSTVSLTKTNSGFALSDGGFISKPTRDVSVNDLNEAEDECNKRGMNLLSAKTLDLLLEGVSNKETQRKPQFFCVGEFAASETAVIAGPYNGGQIEWNFTYNSRSSGNGNILGYRVVCEK